MTVTVRNNTISQTDGNGILLVSRDTNGTLRARVRNNTVAAPLSGARQGIRIEARGLLARMLYLSQGQKINRQP